MTDDFIENIRREEMAIQRQLVSAQIVNTRVMVLCSIAVLIAVIVTFRIWQSTGERPFQYVGLRDAHGVVHYQAENQFLCPGDTLRHKMSVEATAPAIDVEVKYKFLGFDGNNIGTARYEERVLDRPILFSDLDRREAIPHELPPGRYWLVVGATTQNSDSDMYKVGFEILEGCVDFQ